MGIIHNYNQLRFNKNELFYDEKQISKWWGKTLFRFDKAQGTLHYQTFSIFEQFLQLFCYKKEFNTHNLQDWMKAKGLNLQKLTGKNEKIQATENVGFEALSKIAEMKKEFSQLTSKFDADEESIIQLFKKGFPVNSTIIERDCSVLHEACRRGLTKVAAYLIENGAEINTTAIKGTCFVALTPLQAAIELGNENLILSLIEKGADINTSDSKGVPVLSQVINQLNQSPELADWKKIIKVLLEKNISVNTTAEPMSPLYRACKNGNIEIIRLLAEHGAEMNPAENHVKMPIFAAIEQGNIEILRFLLDKGARLDVQTCERFIGFATHTATALSSAIKCKKLDLNVIRLLLEKGADVDQKTGFKEYHRSPLQLAISIGNVELVKLMLEFGAVIYPEDPKSAAHYQPHAKPEMLEQYKEIQQLLEKRFKELKSYKL